MTTSIRNQTRLERIEKILCLYKSGHTLYSIAKEIGISISNIRKTVEAGLKIYNEVHGTSLTYEDLRQTDRLAKKYMRVTTLEERVDALEKRITELETK